MRFVYDGDGSATGAKGPSGSGNIESVFTDYFASQGLASEPTAFDGRSDYGPFIAAGIPAGGLFSGAEDEKTAAQAAIYGGIAGDAYDECYHSACDTIDNVDETVLDQMADAAAHATVTFAMTTSSPNGTSKASAKAMEANLAKLLYPRQPPPALTIDGRPPVAVHHRGPRPAPYEAGLVRRRPS